MNPSSSAVLEPLFAYREYVVISRVETVDLSTYTPAAIPTIGSAASYICQLTIAWRSYHLYSKDNKVKLDVTYIHAQKSPLWE